MPSVSRTWRLSVAAASVLVICASQLNAQMAAHGHHHGKHDAMHSEMNMPHSAHGHQLGSDDASVPHLSRKATPAHGGQMTTVAQQCFEVVYRPKQTRVYLYDSDHRPISAHGTQGELALRVEGNDKWFRFPLKHVGANAEAADYLAAAVDVSRIKNGAMTVAFQMKDQANPQKPPTQFRQTFNLSELTVKVVSVDQSDSSRIIRQKTCPVLDGQLGSMGTPIKVLVGDDPVYLCCKGCLGKVEANPEVYLEKVAQSHTSAVPSASSEITVGTATAADEATIYVQEECPVLGTALGSHGKPIKVSIGKQSLFVCCQGCVAKVKLDLKTYLAKAKRT